MSSDWSEDRTRLLTSPLVAAALPQLRESAPLHAATLTARRGAWASWLARQLDIVCAARRSYPALMLPGQFYDPQGRLGALRPHLELPAALVDSPDANFCVRLAAAGNGLLSPWWVPSEATAARRVITDTSAALPDAVVTLLDRESAGLARALTAVLTGIADHFPDIAATLATRPGDLRDLVADPADTAEITAFWQPAQRLHLTAELDRRLIDKDGLWVARRAGAWTLRGKDWHVGVLAPRLTVSSFCRDPLYDPASESPAALLVRGVLAARIAARFGVPMARVPVPAPHGHLQAIPARRGSTPAHASAEAAVNFLRAYPDAGTAWTALRDWTVRKPGRVLMVKPEHHAEAFARGRRGLARGESPTRADIDTVLPLVWSDGKVSRLTFAKTDPS